MICRADDEAGGAAVSEHCRGGQHAKFEHVSELRRIMAYGAMALPALVIDGKVVAGGNVLGVEEIMQIIKQMQ